MVGADLGAGTDQNNPNDLVDDNVKSIWVSIKLVFGTNLKFIILTRGDIQIVT
jgi:hypothetical protein